MLGDCLVRRLIQNALLLGERVDLSGEFSTLSSEFLDLRVVVVAFLLKRRRSSLPCGKECSGKSCAEAPFYL